MDLSFVFNFLMGLAPWVNVALQVLGAVVVLGTAVDKLLAQGKFVAKLFAIPFLGKFLEQLAAFSPLNVTLKAQLKKK